jgi:hypothetical protein
VSPTWQFIVGARSAPVNTSWGTTLDVNGDGYADVALGRPFADTSTGRVYVYLGGASGPSSAPSTTLLGPDGYSAEFGQSVASAGDVNGDGYADLVVGAPEVGLQVGRAHVYLGGPAGLATTPATTFESLAGNFANFGWSVASAGDVNGDGYADVLVGASAASRGTGRVDVYLGSATGVATAPATTLTGPDGIGSEFGWLTASAGDVNGDGYGDVLLGGYGSGGGGHAYVYLGGAAGLASTPATALAGRAGPFGYFGYAAASPADFNGDGYADVLVSEYGADTNTGSAYAFLGGATGLASAPATVLAGLDGQRSDFGSAIANLGDVDGDGYGDVLVGASRANLNNGVAHLYRGGPAGLASAPATTLTPPTAGDMSFGAVVQGVGDVDGDGYPDLIVWTGHTYLYRGSAAGVSTTPATTLDVSVASRDATDGACRLAAATPRPTRGLLGRGAPRGWTRQRVPPTELRAAADAAGPVASAPDVSARAPRERVAARQRGPRGPA